MMLAIDYGSGIILAAFATGGFGLLAAGLSYWSAMRRQDKAVSGDSNPTGEKPVEFWEAHFQVLEDNAARVSEHHDALTREMQYRFESMVHGFNGKLTEMTVMLNRAVVILDERLPPNRFISPRDYPKDRRG